MISANGGLPAHRYTPQVTQRWPRGSEPASLRRLRKCSSFERETFLLPCEFVLLAFVSDFFVNARASAPAPNNCKAAPSLGRFRNAKRASTWWL